MLNSSTHSETLPDSYYAATQKLQNAYPELTSSIEVDVCVIGGGFSGVNTALELAERGKKVALIEAFQIGWGASGRNGGQLIRGIGHNVEQFRGQIGQEGVDAINLMGLEAVEIVKARVKQYNIQCDLKMGYCDVGHKAKDIIAFEKDKAWLDDIGYAHETKMVYKQDMGEVVGTNAYAGGLIDMGSGHLHPLNLVQGEAKAAFDLGVRIYEHSKVINIQYGEKNVITTPKGKVTADQLVICGNAYVAGLNNHLEARVLPAGSYIIATKPLSNDQWHRVLPQDMAVSDQRVALDYYRLSADKRLIFGGLCTYSGRDPRSIVGQLRPHMDALFPYLANVDIEFQWGGMIGIGANRMPQIGRLHENVYYAQAYSGHGINATHMAAKVIAEHMMEETDRLHYFENISHIKFPGGRRFRSPLLAAGMLFHRAKELI